MKNCKEFFPVLGLIFLISLAGCAQTPVTARFQIETDGREIVWPDPPEQSRYRYVGQLTGEENFQQPAVERGRNLGGRFFRWLVGLVSGKEVPVVLQRPQSGLTGPDGRVYVTDVSRQAVYLFNREAGRLEA